MFECVSLILRKLEKMVGWGFWRNKEDLRYRMTVTGHFFAVTRLREGVTELQNAVTAPRDGVTAFASAQR